MDRYKLKLNNTVKFITGIILSLCTAALIYCVKGITEGRLLVDYVSNAFLLILNLFIIASVINYLINSNYSFSDKGIIIKTAYFKDPVSYGSIKKIMYFATEEELYLELAGFEKNIMHVNINKNDINVFANELKKHIPEIPYEVSLKIENDMD